MLIPRRVALVRTRGTYHVFDEGAPSDSRMRFSIARCSPHDAGPLQQLDMVEPPNARFRSPARALESDRSKSYSRRRTSDPSC